MTTDAKYLERLRSRIQVDENGCWIWQGAKNGSGYGNIRVRGKLKGAHRLMYALAVEPIPRGMHVCHKCDVPLCVNPEHLFIGTHNDNMQDAIVKDRLPIVRTGSRNQTAKFTADQVIYYRHKFQSGTTIAEIVNESGASKTAVCSMLQGRTYQEIALFKRDDSLVNVKGGDGLYLTPWGEYNSAVEAAEAYDGDMHFSTVYRYCRDNNQKKVRRSSVARSSYLKPEDAGKTYAELGFGFVEN